MIRDRDQHLFSSWLFKQTRLGQSPEAFARVWYDLPISKAYLMEIGAELEVHMKLRDGSRKSSRLGRLGVKVCTKLGLNGYETDNPLLTDFIAGLFQYSDDHNGNRFSPDREVLAARGYLIGMATVATALDLPLDPGPLAAIAHHVMLKDRRSLSITDVRRALSDITRHGPLTDWILQEDVDRLRAKFSKQQV